MRYAILQLIEYRWWSWRQLRFVHSREWSYVVGFDNLDAALLIFKGMCRNNPGKVRLYQTLYIGTNSALESIHA